jgi:hypothetical protein
MIGTLKRLARLQVVPTFGRNLYQLTVHADDVGAGLVKLADRPRFGEPLGCAPVPVAFERIVREVGDGRPAEIRSDTLAADLWRTTRAEQVGLRLPGPR